MFWTSVVGYVQLHAYICFLTNVTHRLYTVDSSIVSRLRSLLQDGRTKIIVIKMLIFINKLLHLSNAWYTLVPCQGTTWRQTWSENNIPMYGSNFLHPSPIYLQNVCITVPLVVPVLPTCHMIIDWRSLLTL